MPITKSASFFVLIFGLAISFATTVPAQGIKLSTQPYEDKPALLFAPPQVLVNAKPPPNAVQQVPIPAVLPKWEVQVADLTYASTFRRWGLLSGYRVKWDAQRHVLVDGPDTVLGSFETAIEQILASPSISNSDYPLEVCFYPNTPPLARVTRRGEQVNDCK